MSESLVRIDTVATKMNMLIGELLDFAHLQVGQPLDLNRRPTDLVALARQVAAEYQHSTDRHHIRMEHTTPKVVGLWDAPRLERVLDNLLSNAIKYTQKGGEITIQVGLEDVEGYSGNGKGPQAVLVVRDQGIGIPASDLPYVFEWFRRAGNVSGRIGGTGIGLASARQVVEQHGGTISVESQEGQGTTFTVRLPLATLEANDATAPLDPTRLRV